MTEEEAIRAAIANWRRVRNDNPDYPTAPGQEGLLTTLKVFEVLVDELVVALEASLKYRTEKAKEGE